VTGDRTLGAPSTSARLDAERARLGYDEMERAGEFAPSPDLPLKYQRLHDEVMELIPADTGELGAAGARFAVDAELGFLLHKRFPVAGIGYRTAGDDGFWRYLAVRVLPDAVRARYGPTPKYFWKSRVHIWPRRMWWFIHLTWQGSEDATRAVVSRMSTDFVASLVERPGRAGFRVEASRALISRLKGQDSFSQHDFRLLMKCNTAFLRTVEPSLVPRGEAGGASVVFRAFRRLSGQAATAPLLVLPEMRLGEVDNARLRRAAGALPTPTLVEFAGAVGVTAPSGGQKKAIVGQLTSSSDGDWSAGLSSVTVEDLKRIAKGLGLDSEGVLRLHPGFDRRQALERVILARSFRGRASAIKARWMHSDRRGALGSLLAGSELRAAARLLRLPGRPGSWASQRLQAEVLEGKLPVTDLFWSLPGRTLQKLIEAFTCLDSHEVRWPDAVGTMAAWSAGWIPLRALDDPRANWLDVPSVRKEAVSRALLFRPHLKPLVDGLPLSTRFREALGGGKREDYEGVFEYGYDGPISSLLARLPLDAFTRLSASGVIPGEPAELGRVAAAACLRWWLLRGPDYLTGNAR
jgi:hypothetical protein